MTPHLDDLVQRLRGGTMRLDWADLHDDALIPAVPLLREAATALSALRARVAELEASATPPAGASEAEPLAYASNYGLEQLAKRAHHYCLALHKESEKEFVNPLYATPPDSDAVRAMREALHSSVCLLETMAETAKDVGDIANWSLMSVMAEQGRAALSNQGCSSNGQ